MQQQDTTSWSISGLLAVDREQVLQEWRLRITKDSTERANLAEGSVGRTLITLTIPMLFAVLAMVVFNLVDTAFVGRLGTEELA